MREGTAPIRNRRKVLGITESIYQLGDVGDLDGFNKALQHLKQVETIRRLGGYDGADGRFALGADKAVSDR
ncbi:MAG: hypothetical protein HY246_03995 [Proteobacteria bacterium]|nr:hypothetical protein [Pseudomonadota bacterium]